MSLPSEVWQSLPNLNRKESYFSDFLNTLCRLIPETEFAGVFWVSSEQQLKVLANYPTVATQTSLLVPVCEKVLAERCGMAMPVYDKHQQNSVDYFVGFPVEVDQHIQIIVSLAIKASNDKQLHNIMGQLEWSLAQVGLYLQQQKFQQLEQSSINSIRANEIVGQVLAQTDFKKACVSLVEQLAESFQCERVSLGHFQNQKSEIITISNTLDFSHKLALVDKLQAVQLEAKLQLSTIQFPNIDDSTYIVRAHQSLSESYAHNQVLTLLIFDYQKQLPIFAITLERDGKQPFVPSETEQISHITALAGEVVYEKWLLQQPLSHKIKQKITQQFIKLFGPGHTYRKVTLLSAAILITLFSLLEGEYWLASDAKIEASQQYLVTMPYDGYLHKAYVKAGDQVSQAQKLAQLDQREQKLELLKAQAKKQQMLTEFASVQAQQDRVAMAELRSQIEQVEADIELTQLVLNRSTIKAPINGLVIEGDLTQRAGDAIQTGEVLFIIAKADQYRVWIEVPESRILDIKTGQTGRLVLHSLPAKDYSFTVKQVSPMQKVAEGNSFFRVEAELKADDLLALKPGMQGVAKIYIDQRNQFSIWIRDSYEWFKLTIWRWWG